MSVNSHIMAELGLVQWRLRQAPARDAETKPQEPAVPTVKAAETLLVDQAVVQATGGVQAATVCSIVMPAQASAPIRRICGDVMHFLNLREVPCRRLDADALEVLPQAPALCFYPHITQVQQDDAGRLQLPVSLDAIADGEWKPALWAYLQNLLAD